MKNEEIMKFDSLMFDMDGTLWDNVDSYAIVWNRALEVKGYSNRVDRDSLIGLMGKESRQLLDAVAPNASVEDQDMLFDEVIKQYNLFVPHMKPKMYDGVLEGLEKLSKRYPLFLLSNCEEGGLVNFMNHTKTTHLFKDYMEHGQNLKPKAHNMKLLSERNNLKSPVYIGDTDGDSKSSELAGLPFAFAAYGFGKTDRYELKFNSFVELTDFFLEM